MNDKTPLPILDLSWAFDANKRPELLEQLRSALLDVGFLYIKNHGVSPTTISNLTDLLPPLFSLPASERASMSKLNSPHFLGYSGFAEETTMGKQDLREQFDFATELPVVYTGEKSKPCGHVSSDVQHGASRDLSKLYWRLRGPNQWPSESSLPGFREACTQYHDALQELSYRFVHLIEEAFEIPIGTFDLFFGLTREADEKTNVHGQSLLPPQHRIKLLKYPPAPSGSGGQGVGAHKDSSGWLTFLYQVGDKPGLEVMKPGQGWIKAAPISDTFVVNFGNALEAATEGAVRATIHRVIAPDPESDTRYSIPFFQGLPLDMTVSEVKSYIPLRVRKLGKEANSGEQVSSFLDPRWDNLGESQLRKWIRSHPDVAVKWYGQGVVDYYTT